MTLIEAARLALGELSKIAVAMPYPVGRNAITALRTAVEQAEKQEPVAWMDEFGNVFPLGAQRGPKYLNEPMKPLYTTSPAAQRQPLTDEQLKPIADEYRILFGGWVVDFARAIEAAHGIKEKNHG